MLFGIVQRFQSMVEHGLQKIGALIAHWTTPRSPAPARGTIGDLVRGKPHVVAESLLLRQQLLVLHRSVNRPRLTPIDCALLVLLASRVDTWTAALLIVKPETVRRWHRQGFRLFWKRRSHAIARRPQIPIGTIALIKEMAANNRLWGAERIQGELLKVGVTVAKRTIQRYMCHVQSPRPHGQTWATFLQNHANDIWACDFLQVYDLFFRPLFAFVITDLGSRRIVQIGVTQSPRDAWITQQLREATLFGQAPKYLIRDNDAKYGAYFDAVAVGRGMEIRRTPIKAPRADAICERLLGSVRRECLDHILVMGEAHLRPIVTVH